MAKKRNILSRNLFKRTYALEEKITAFLLNIIEAGVLYAQAMDIYTQKGACEDFITYRDKVSELEGQNDSYRRAVENDLYKYMILPDMRSDILILLEGCDEIINTYQSDLLIVSVEKPVLPSDLKDNLLKMIRSDLDCVDRLIAGTRAFFNGESVTVYTDQTRTYEHIVDQQALDLKTRIYQNKELTLAHQLQLKEFIYHIEKISDIAEDVADALSIMAVKHSL